jgi:uncharacterized membrane protein YraQ (UPF0718 family)
MVKVMFTPLVKDTCERYVLGYIGAYVLTKSGVDIQCTAPDEILQCLIVSYSFWLFFSEIYLLIVGFFFCSVIQVLEPDNSKCYEVLLRGSAVEPQPEMDDG